MIGIACPKCGRTRFEVLNVRPHVGRLVRSRCSACGHVIRTAERVESTVAMKPMGEEEKCSRCRSGSLPADGVED